MPKRTLDFRDEPLKDLADPAEAACYVNAALEDSEEMFLIALRDVAEAHRLSKVASEAGVSRESIYRMLSKTGNPTHATLMGILKALNLRLSVEVAGPAIEGPAMTPGYKRRAASMRRRIPTRRNGKVPAPRRMRP